MKNIKIILEYDGTKYNGWQRQGNTSNTIQEKIESILSKYFNQSIEIHGSGRTDAGVHAKGQVANFHYDNSICENRISSLSNNTIKFELNGFLPEDIRIISLIDAEPRFHARLNAKQKRYRYSIEVSDKKSVFSRKYNMHLNTMPNVDAMKEASKLFLGTHDLIAFSDTKTKKSTVRTIDSIDFAICNEDNSTFITIDYIGNGFLYHTVRLITGTLLSVGLGEHNKSIIEDIFMNNNRKQVPFMAPAEGLSLMEVMY